MRITLGTANALSLIFFSHKVLPLLASPSTKKSNIATTCFVLLHTVQFHFLFWAGRTTHNSLVLGPSKSNFVEHGTQALISPPLLSAALIALALILRSSAIPSQSPTATRRGPLMGVALLVFCGAVLRAELIGLLLPSCLWLLALRKVSIAQLATVGLVTLSAAIGESTNVTAASHGKTHPTTSLAGIMTLLDKPLWVGIHESTPTPVIDSVLPSSFALALHSLEQSIFWPELEALKFNVLQGKSADWGVMPWHFYLSNALPKLLTFTSPLVILHLVRMATQRADDTSFTEDRSTAPADEKTAKRKIEHTPLERERTQRQAQIGLLAIVLGHVGVLSLLGHKEWRFIVNVVPCLNAFAATELASM